MSSDHPRLVLVFANRKAVEQANQLAPGLILENAVRDKIARDDVDRLSPGILLVTLHAHGVVARVKRALSLLTGRKCWTITNLAQLDRRAAA